MDPLDAAWHLLNFVAPAIGIGVIAPWLSRAIWRSDSNAKGTLVLMAWTSAASVAVLTGGLLVFGHDGRMATYAAMVLVVAAILWWTGPNASKR